MRSIRPRVWQTKLIQLLRRRLNTNNVKGKDVLVHAGPGAGKTLGALLSFKKLRKEGLLENLLVFCHRNSIASQWKNSAEKLGLCLEEFESYPSHQTPPISSDGWIVTYQGSSRNIKAFGKSLELFSSQSFLAIADEAHHLGVDPEEPEGAAWGRAFIELTKSSKLRLGLTGTPFRADNLAFCSGRKIRRYESGELLEQINPDLCVDSLELISAGDVRPLEFHFQDGLVEHGHLGQIKTEGSQISNERRESWRARNLRRAIRLSDQSSIAELLLVRARKKLEEVRILHANAAGLVIAKDIEHAISITNLLEENGESVELVHSHGRQANERLSAFQQNRKTWLVSVDMCSEGFDAPRLRVIAYLTTVVTKSRFLQGITRAVRMSPERASAEPIPRNPSYIYAPADPLLMEYAQNWTQTKPYLIRSNSLESSAESISWQTSGPLLPMEAINDEAGEIIKIRPTELPNFLKG